MEVLEVLSEQEKNTVFDRNRAGKVEFSCSILLNSREIF